MLNNFCVFEELVFLDLWILDSGFRIPDSGFRFPGFRVAHNRKTLGPSPNVVLLPYRTKMNLPRQCHDKRTAVLSNV